MRTDEAHPIRLEDYRASNWLVETVHLDVSLDPAHTRVRPKPTLNAKPRQHHASAGRYSTATNSPSPPSPSTASRWRLTPLLRPQTA